MLTCPDLRILRARRALNDRPSLSEGVAAIAPSQPWSALYWMPSRPAPERFVSEPSRRMVSVPVGSGVPATTLFRARLGLGFQIVPVPSTLVTDSHHVRSRRLGWTRW